MTDFDRFKVKCAKQKRAKAGKWENDGEGMVYYESSVTWVVDGRCLLMGACTRYNYAAKSIMFVQRAEAAAKSSQPSSGGRETVLMSR